MNTDWWAVIIEWGAVIIEWGAKIDWAAIATAVLAVITAWYVRLVGKTLIETREMARATQDLAQSSRRPNLVIEKNTVSDRHVHQIKNIGAGLAKDIKITLDDNEPIDVHAEIHPGGITEGIKPLYDAHRIYGTVKLSCKDALDIQSPPFWFKHSEQGEWVATAPQERH